MTASPARTAADSNVARFIAFRVLFNARFYYPVIAVLFLDFGLTMEQYALLNVVWAVSIVLLEVPSGALADRIGRKRMVVFASALMVIEMLVLCFAPIGPSLLIFILFLFNRFLSGAAEASASGADEALAYDALAAENRQSEWSEVLNRLMKIQSIAFVVAMIIGAAVYDPALMNSIGSALGMDWGLVQVTSLRFPIYLTTGMAFGALFVSLGMREPPHADDGEEEPASTWAATWEAGRWILHSRRALLIILVAVCCDSVVRLLLTICSEYYRLIQLPEFSFGLLGAAFGALGFVVAPLAKRMVAARSAQFNFGVLAVLIFVSLYLTALVIPVTGFIFVLLMGVAMVLLNFFLSHYLNAIVSSRMRATVLSFKGLAMNVAFGGISLFFAGLLRTIRERDGGDAFAEALGWLPWYFLVTFCAVAIFGLVRRPKAEA